MSRKNTGAIELEGGWTVYIVVDEDDHLNIYIKNSDLSNIFKVDTGQGSGTNGEQLAQRYTTEAIEEEYFKNENE